MQLQSLLSNFNITCRSFYDRLAEFEDVIRSKDGGKTWSAPKTVADEPPDSRNPAFGQAADGRVVLESLGGR